MGPEISKNPSEIGDISSEAKFDVNIHPRHINGVEERFRIKVEQSLSIEDLKIRIYQLKKCCLPDSFMLRWKNEVLRSDQSIISAQIMEGDTLQMLPVLEQPTVTTTTPLSSVVTSTNHRVENNFTHVPNQPSQNHMMSEAEVLLRRGNAYAKQNLFKEAIVEFSKSLVQKPNYISAMNNRSACYSELGMTDKSIEDLIRIVQIDERNEEALFLLGNAYYREKNDFENSLRYYEKCIQVNPNHTGALSVGALAWRRLGNLPKSLEWLNNLLRLKPNDAKGLYNRARVFVDLKRFQPAKVDLERLLMNEPKHEAASVFLRDVNKNYSICLHFQRGLKAAEKHDYNDSLKHFQSILQLDPNNSDAYGNLGLIFLRLGNYHQGAEMSTKAIYLQQQQQQQQQQHSETPDKKNRILKNIAASYHNRALCYRNLKDYANSVRDFDTYLTLVPRVASAYSYRGECYSELGETELAFRDFDEAIRLNPKEQSSYIHRGNTYFEKLKNYELALKDYTMAIQVDPKNSQTYYTFVYRGNTFFELSRYEEALLDYNQAIKIDSKHRLAHFKKDELLERLKKNEQQQQHQHQQQQQEEEEEELGIGIEKVFVSSSLNKFSENIKVEEEGNVTSSEEELKEDEDEEEEEPISFHDDEQQQKQQQILLNSDSVGMNQTNGLKKGITEKNIIMEENNNNNNLEEEEEEEPISFEEEEEIIKEEVFITLPNNNTVEEDSEEEEEEEEEDTITSTPSFLKLMEKSESENKKGTTIIMNMNDNNNNDEEEEEENVTSSDFFSMLKSVDIDMDNI